MRMSPTAIATRRVTREWVAAAARERVRPAPSPADQQPWNLVVVVAPTVTGDDFYPPPSVVSLQAGEAVVHARNRSGGAAHAALSPHIGQRSGSLELTIP
jgi:hypothetical protein